MKTFITICLFFFLLSCEHYSNKNENLIVPEFQIEGSWYVNDSGEHYSSNALNFFEYSFGAPSIVKGKVIGIIEAVPFNDLNARHIGQYEILNDNKLKISFPNELDYDFAYIYFPEEQKIEMEFADQSRTLIREKIEIDPTKD